MHRRVAKPPARGPPAKRPNSSEEPPLPAKRARSTLSSTELSGQVSPATLLRKRQIDGDSNDEDGARQLKRARLTRQNLALFNKMGKKKDAKKASASAPPESTIQSSTTRTTSTTTSGFALQADKNGILLPLDSNPPENLEALRQRLARSRETASPPESVYERYAYKVGTARNESTMVVEMAPLLKEYEDRGYDRVFNQAFTAFPKDVGFNNCLSAPQPDFVEGLSIRQYRPFPVDEHVSGAALYKDDPHSLALPHVAGEWKGRGKDMEEARMQSAYDGAALVYARNQALSTIGKSESPGHAQVTTFTTDGTNINFFAHYAAQSEDGVLEYHQYPVTSTNLKNSHGEFKQGRRQLRNGQDHAREQSYALRDQLKEHWKKQGAVSGLGPIAEGVVALPVLDEEAPPDTTNAYDTGQEAGYEMVEQPYQLTPAAPSNAVSVQHDKASSSRSSSSKSKSKSARSRPPSSDGSVTSSSKKRKPSSSRSKSVKCHNDEAADPYWNWDDTYNRFFHVGADGRITWAEEEGQSSSVP